MPSLTRNSTGLVLAEAFDAANGWTAGTGWSRVTKPTLVTFGPNLEFIGPTEGSGSDEELGKTGVSLFIDGDGSWYIFSFSGNWDESGIMVDRSTDRGITWTRLGFIDCWNKKTGSVNFTTGFAWPGWIEKRGGVYYLHRICCDVARADEDTWLPGWPQYGDIWTNSTSDIMTGWTFHSSLPYDEYEGTWANEGVLPECVVLHEGTYYRVTQSRPVAPGDNEFVVGYATGSTPVGPWTLGPDQEMGPARFYYEHSPEGVHVFYHPTLGKWIGLCNLLPPSSATLQNGIFVADTISDWTEAPTYIVQRIPQDAAHAIGIFTHFTEPEGALTHDVGYVPFVYDGNPEESLGAGDPIEIWERGRKVIAAVLEPSPYALRYSAAGPARNRYHKSLAHTDFIAEWAFVCDDLAASSDVAFEFRTDGSAGYRMLMPTMATGARKLRLLKMDGTVIAEGSGSHTIDAAVDIKVKLSVSGTAIKAWLDRELQIDTADATYASGTQIAFSAVGIDADVRLFHLRSSDTLTVRGLGAGQTIWLRSPGQVPVVSATANGGGVATVDHEHWPMSRVQGSDGDAQTSDALLWGGDDVEYVPDESTHGHSAFGMPVFGR